jgi:predicted nucleic-acid-binding Zn-ribbon protein
MQILFLVEDIKELWKETSEQLAQILKYNKAKSQNILLSDRAYISNSIALKCLILNNNQIQKNVMLSPSLIINLLDKDTQEDIEKYFRIKWSNTQLCFWKMKNINKGKILKLKNTSYCIAYTTNLENPNFKIVAESITHDHYSGLVEQAITEYFANRDFFNHYKSNKNDKVLKNRSSIFYVQYEAIKDNADFTININSIVSLNFQQLLNLNIQFVYDYLDAVLKFRLDYYVEQVKFRQYIIGLCEENEIDFEPSYFRTFVLSKEDKIGLQRSYFGGVNDLGGIETIRDKHLTNVFLKEKGFKTNVSYEYLLSELNDEKVIENIPLKYPLVLKPTDKKEGYGVVTNILNPERMFFSIQELIELGDIEPVLIEEFFIGVTYRVLVVGGEVIAVLKFMPTYIIGNGKESIEELIHSKNQVSRSRIRVNDALKLSIFNDGYNWNSVLPESQKYILSHNSHAAMGGQATNVTDIFKDKYKQIACKVCESLELTHAGIDMNINAEGDYRILEVNCAPALSTHLYPRYGTPIDTYSKVLEAFFSHTDVQKTENRYLTELIKYHQ